MFHCGNKLKFGFVCQLCGVSITLCIILILLNWKSVVFIYLVKKIGLAFLMGYYFPEWLTVDLLKMLFIY